MDEKKKKIVVDALLSTRVRVTMTLKFDIHGISLTSLGFRRVIILLVSRAHGQFTFNSSIR